MCSFCSGRRRGNPLPDGHRLRLRGQEGRGAHRDNEKVDHFPEKQPVGDFLAMDHDLPLEIALLSRQQHADEGHDDVLRKPTGCPCMVRKRSEEHTSELQSPCNLVCRLLLEKKKHRYTTPT